MDVVIIGSGNVATILAKKILQAGHKITQVVGRNKANVDLLASPLNAAASYNLSEVNTNSDLYIISVSDSSIPVIADQLHLDNKLVVHTAASVSQEVLKPCSANYGIVYPVQTLKKEMTSIPEIPVLVNGSNEETKNTLLEFSKGWASSVQLATDEERLKLHVAAVIVNNFTNHLFSLVQNYCKAENLNFDILSLLTKETIDIIEQNDSFNFQTGPAVRKDMSTIEKHQQLLEQHPLLQEVYTCMTKSIISYHQ